MQGGASALPPKIPPHVFLSVQKGEGGEWGGKHVGFGIKKKKCNVLFDREHLNTHTCSMQIFLAG